MDENPYNPLQPTVSPQLFFGREDSIGFLKLNLSGRMTHNALVILGQHGIGKSSLLAQIPHFVDERYPSIYIDLAILELEEPVALIAAIVDQIRSMMEKIQASTYRLPAFPDPTAPDIDLLKWFADDYLEVVFAAIRRERHLIMMFDNLHLLLDAVDTGKLSSDFLAYLMGLLERYEQLDLLVALDIIYEERILKLPPFNDTTLHHRLTFLSNEAAIGLITEPVSYYYEFTPNASVHFLELTGGHPFHIHSIGRLIFRRWSETRHLKTIDVDEVDAVYPIALEMVNETSGQLWEHLRPNERLVLTAMLDLYHGSQHVHPLDIQTWLADTEFSLNDLQVSAAFRGLEYWDILKIDDEGQYYFASKIQAEWLAQQHGQATIKKTSTPYLWSVLAIITAILLLGLIIVVVSVLDDTETQINTSNRAATVTLESTPRPTNTPTSIPKPPFLFGG